ncbi:MAG: hypothetical protein WCI11_19980 [Candidatus Methylumidiphilus sp.]
MDEIQVEDQWGSWGKLANPSRVGWQRPFDKLRTGFLLPTDCASSAWANDLLFPRSSV